MSHLLPCPFCGENNPEIEHMEGTILHPAYVVKCGHCGAQAPWCDKGNHEANWNQRAKPRAPVADERAAFERAYEAEFAFRPLWDEQLCDGKGAYATSQQRNAYRIWQAARAALASAPVAGEVVSIPDEAYTALQYVEGSLAAIANRQEVVGDVVNGVDTRLQAVAHYFDAAPQASKPVAGEAQSPIGYVDPVYVVGRQRGMKWNAKIYDAPTQEATAPLYAAPQASEAVRDAARLDYLENLRETAKTKKYQWDAWRFFALQNDQTIRQQLDAALSAQPGKQAKENDS